MTCAGQLIDVWISPATISTSCTNVAGRHGRGYKEQRGYNDDEGEQQDRPTGRSGDDNPRGIAADLDAALRRLDGQGYKAYHDVEGAWACPGYTFVLDRAQSDPFAPPSRCRVLVGHLHDTLLQAGRPAQERSVLVLLYPKTWY